MSYAKVPELFVIEHTDRAQHIFSVKKGLTHAHIDHVVYFAADFFLNCQHLSRYFAGAEVALKA